MKLSDVLNKSEKLRWNTGAWELVSVMSKRQAAEPDEGDLHRTVLAYRGAKTHPPTIQLMALALGLDPEAVEERAGIMAESGEVSQYRAGVVALADGYLRARIEAGDGADAAPLADAILRSVEVRYRLARIGWHLVSSGVSTT